MNLIQDIHKKASKRGKRIVLPEGSDDRMFSAAEKIVREGICEVTLLGSPEVLQKRAKELGVSLKGVHLMEPGDAAHKKEFAKTLFDLRKHKGMTPEEAEKKIVEPLFWGAMMVRMDQVDGSVAGASNTTGDVLRAGLQCIGLAENISVVSSTFLMIVPGREKAFSFADCAVVPDPDPRQLASIAITSANTHRKLTGDEPIVAMLSFSTYGSAEHEMVDKVKEATRIAKELAPDLKIDGELQFDAAIVPAIGQKKAPGSTVAGKANVMIFPNLDAGNIAYKITQRLAGAEAIGPIIQGLKKPANDLSRGCSVDDIVTVVAICCLLSD